MFNAHTTGIIKSVRVSLRTSGINSIHSKKHSEHTY